MKKYSPEGKLIGTQENKNTISSYPALLEAMKTNSILEARAILCDNSHNLHVELGDGITGIIPREEGAVGIDDGSVKYIALISRVNKPVCFRVKDFTQIHGRKTAVLSRKSVQESCAEEYLSNLNCGDIIDAKITHMEPFGAFADIGAGISSLLPIDSISVSRIPHPNVRFTSGQDIKAVVKSFDDKGRITLTHKELLGTWEQNADSFKPGETVPGIVRSVEKYGIFVELTPNLAGLAEYTQGIESGQSTCVYIKSIIPERMKVKLIIVDAFDCTDKNEKLSYYTDAEHIDRWIYSPACSDKVIESIF